MRHFANLLCILVWAVYPSYAKLTKNGKVEVVPPQSDKCGNLDVLTAQGPVQGIIEDGEMTMNSYSGVRTWLGIPFAKPPIEELRWTDPQPPENYLYLNANTPSPSCMNTEDCLYLDIYAPMCEADPTDYPNGYPVMVWIYGGGFKEGQSSTYVGIPFAYKNTVVVVPNYRLGLLGQLALPSILTGNYNFKDQQFALKWIKANIQGFGGNPDHITLGGESAGGTSVCLHMISPHSQGLFHAAISQSSYWGFGNLDTLSKGHEIGSYVNQQSGCPTGDLTCLRGLNFTQISILQNQVNTEYGPAPISSREDCSYDTFYPMVDGTIIPQQPLEAFIQGNVADVPFLSGTNQDEAAAFGDPGGCPSEPLTSQEDLIQQIIDYFGSENIYELLALYPPPSNRKTYPYLNPQTRKNDWAAPFYRMFTDYWYWCPMLQAIDGAQAHGKLKQTYVYQFQFLPSLNIFYPPDSCCRTAICHADELPFVFDNYAASLYPSDAQVGRSTNSAWVNFIQTYNPSQGDFHAMVQGKYPLYEDYHKNKKKTVQLINLKPSIAHQYRAKQCAFWNHPDLKISGYCQPK